ncbi:MATE family efflux transporter [Mucilaginibacter sp.]
MQREKLLTENLWRLMLRMSVPGIISMVVVSINSLVDAFFIAHLVGPAAFTGITFTLPLLTLNSAIVGLLSAGTSAIYSRAIGNSNEPVKNKLFVNLTLLVIGCAALLIILGFAFGNQVLQLLGPTAEQLKYGWLFYQTSLSGAVTSIFGMCLSGLIRAEGNPRTAMYITGLAMALNVVINPLLIKYAGLGVQGSALASIIAMCVYSGIAYHYFYSGKGQLRINWVFEPDLRFMQEILSTGLPSFYMQLNGILRQFVLFKLMAYSSASPNDTIAFSAIYRLFSFAAIPMFGMLQAFAPIIGVNFGAGNLTRVRTVITVFRYGIVTLMLLMALPCLLFPKLILSLLLSLPALTKTAVYHFRVIAGILLLMPLASTSIVYLQATKKPHIASRFTLSRELLLFLPVLWLSVYAWGNDGVYYGLLIENIIYISITTVVTAGIMKNDLLYSFKAAT